MRSVAAADGLFLEKLISAEQGYSTYDRELIAERIWAHDFSSITTKSASSQHYEQISQ